MSSSDWVPKKLGELGFVGRGKSRHRPRNDPSLYGGNYPFIQTGNVKAADLYITTWDATYNEKGLAQSRLWEPETLLITIAANIAETAILKIEACFPDSIVGFIAYPEKSDALFVKYYIDTIKLQMQNASRGTTQDNLSLDKLLTFDIKTPPLETQRQIAAILSAYDDLIENNSRRIKVLEEMAGLIYREWFVNFRFPGHEGVEMVASEFGEIPEGWTVTKLGSVSGVNTASIKRGEEPEEIEYIDIASVSTNKLEQTTRYLFSDAPGRARRKVQHGDTIWATVRPNRRSYTLILNPNENLIASTGFAVLTPSKVPFSYLYQLTTTNDFADYLTNNATGSAYPAVNTADFLNADVLLPPQGLLSKYHGIAEPMYLERDYLARKNQILRQTRDLLLPKLISGELDVSLIGADPEAEQAA